VSNICKLGFANLATTDEGFFGKGIYFSMQADYSARVYGEGVMFLCFLATINPYPIVWEDRNRFRGKGNYANYDSHFAPVVPTSSRSNHPFSTSIYEPVKDREQPIYDELVAFQDASVVIRYVIYYEMVR